MLDVENVVVWASALLTDGKASNIRSLLLLGVFFSIFLS